jgi:lysyl-tRNA synthetase class I
MTDIEVETAVVRAVEQAARVAENATYTTYMMWDHDCLDPVSAPIPHRDEIAAMIRKLKPSIPQPKQTIPHT